MNIFVVSELVLYYIVELVSFSPTSFSLSLSALSCYGRWRSLTYICEACFHQVTTVTVRIPRKEFDPMNFGL